MGAMLKEMFPDTVMHQDFVWHWCANEGSDYPSSGCECNTMMRYGWTGNQTLQAPNPAEDPDFSKWTIVDARFEDTPVIPCNHHKLGGVLPFPLANERICQCLDSTTLALFNAGLQATIGGPDVPGQTLFNMTNHTHYYNKTHVDYVREQHRAAAAAANASDHPAGEDRRAQRVAHRCRLYSHRERGDARRRLCRRLRRRGLRSVQAFARVRARAGDDGHRFLTLSRVEGNNCNQS